MSNANEPDQSGQSEQSSESEHDKRLREQARERVKEMPAESALGHRDPQGGGEGEPSDYEGEHR